MANKSLFGTKSIKKVATVDTVNAAGGRAYSRSDEHALAQFAATGMFKNTYYVNAKDQLTQVLEIAKNVDPEFLAKVAVYSREAAYLKDMPALLLAVLLTKDSELFKKAFPHVVDNAKMLRNFVQIVRSGITGRNSLGTVGKKACQAWFDRQSDDYIFKGIVGNDPSLADVIKMVHPRPATKAREALFGYILEKDHSKRSLPKLVKEFEKFKATDPGKRELPDVPFQLLDSAGLSTEEWTEVAKNGKWQFTRMNLNTFKRHGVLEQPDMVKLIATRLGDKALVKSARQYPFQILTAYKAVQGTDIPASIIKSLHDAVDHCVDNIPEFDGKTAVLVDISGSMSCPVNGRVQDWNTPHAQVTCRETAGLFAAAIARKNPDVSVYQFATHAKKVSFDPFDTIFTNTTKITTGTFGGTDISAGLQKLMTDYPKNLPDNVIVISDMESWSGYYGHAWGGTNVAHQWAAYKAKNKKAKLILIDLTPTANQQVNDNPDVLNVGGFSDAVFDVIAGFLQSRGKTDFWADKISKEVSL